MNSKYKLVSAVRQVLVDKKEELIKLSNKATSGSVDDSLVDLERSLGFLNSFNESHIPPNLKAKGDILIILSYNEPLLLSIVPIISALLIGNKVIVRPSSKNVELFNMIWENIPEEYINKLIISNFEISELENFVKKVKSVYFFGSLKNAKKVYEFCAKNFVEFFPEIEAADCKVLNYQTLSNEQVENDFAITLRNSFDHNGAICQRISGLYINKEIYDAYLSYVSEHLRSAGFSVAENFNKDNFLEEKILSSNPKVVLKKDDVYVVISPDINSDYYKDSYFNKTLWLQEYESVDSLINLLNGRLFFLGLNIKSDNTENIDKIVSNTNFSRYTLNDEHVDIKNDIGWGGNWPSGSGGYKSWYETFSNKYTIIQ